MAKSKRKRRWNMSATALLLANLLSIALSVWQKWNLGDLLITYWAQSVSIGFFTWLRMRTLKQFTTGDLKMGDRPVEPTPANQRGLSWFFVAHYGFFHLIYLFFLRIGAAEGWLPQPSTALVAVGITAFVANQALAYYARRREDENRQVDIGIVMFFPYARILPMHLTIILGAILFRGSNLIVLLVLLGLKTVADIQMHLMEQSV